MNVSKKLMVIIYVIFALLISIVIFASQSILDSSYSNLEQEEAIDNIEKVKNIVDSQVMELDGANLALSSQNETRVFMQSPDPLYMESGRLNNCCPINENEIVFFVNPAGEVIYSYSIDHSSANTSVPPEVRRLISDGTLLCRIAGDNTHGLLLLDAGPMIVSTCPVFNGSEGDEVLGTVIMGKYMDAAFIEYLQKITNNPLMIYRLDSVPSNFQNAFFADKHQTFMHTVVGDRVVGYFVLDDVTGEPAVMIRTDLKRHIYAEGQETLRYIVLILLFAGLVTGAICKVLLDREVVSRLLVIDDFVERVGKGSNLSDRLVLEGDDEFTNLADGINGMLDRLGGASEEVKAQVLEKKVILNSLSELLIFMDSELRIVWANKASLKHLYKKLDDVVGQRYDEVCILCDNDLDNSPVGQALKTGKTEIGELTNHDGRVWKIRAIPIKDECGKITGILQTGLDISEDKWSEQKLLRAKLEAEAASRTKSEFLANMSHELRTPLNSIIGFSDILLERVFGELNDRQVKYVTNISTSGKHLLQLINDILDLSKVEAGKMELHYSDFSFTGISEEVKTALSPLAKSKSIEMTFSTEPGFKNLEADRSRLIQVLYNLMSNAIKFTPEGGKVSVYAKMVGDMAHISVTDTGIGIDNNDIEKLFQPFIQLDSSASRQYGGTGLGLALVKKIVNLHGGDVRVQSELSKGSTFTFFFPFRKPKSLKKLDESNISEKTLKFILKKDVVLSEESAVEDLESSEVPCLPEILEPEKMEEMAPLILVVDDDRGSNELLTLVLLEAGYRVSSLYAGKHVLQFAKQLKPDIITLDVFLPDINGWQVLKQLKNNLQTRNIPVLIITMADKNNMGIVLGAAHSFTKPVERPELLDALNEISSTFEFNTPKILVVDDEKNAVELIHSMLEPEGFDVIRAYGGKEGLNKLFSELPDILILDLMMPDVSGFDVISKMRADPRTKDIPLIVCTAGEFDEKSIEKLNGELKSHLISIMKKGTFGRTELINRINQFTINRGYDDEEYSDC